MHMDVFCWMRFLAICAVRHEVEDVKQEPPEADALTALRSHERLDRTVVAPPKRCGFVASPFGALPHADRPLLVKFGATKSRVMHHCAAQPESEQEVGLSGPEYV
jgi:hypothetical protein